MQYLQGSVLFSLIPRHGEESLSEVAQPQAEQKYWSWGQNVLHLLPFSRLVTLIHWISYTGMW